MSENREGEKNPLTEPGLRFVLQHTALLALPVYVLDLALEGPDRYRGENPGASRSEVAESMSLADQGKLDQLDLHRWLLDEMLLCRAVDNFLVYLEELLGLVYSTRPETLRSSEQVRVDFVLEHSSMEDLIKSLARRRVGLASIQGTRKLLESFSALGLDVFRKEDVDHGVRLIETRNAIVHNRGRVDETFIRRVGATTEKVGDRIHVDRLGDEMQFLFDVVLRNDQAAVDHFHLPKCERWPGFPGYSHFLRVVPTSQ